MRNKALEGFDNKGPVITTAFLYKINYAYLSSNMRSPITYNKEYINIKGKPGKVIEGVLKMEYGTHG